ncbi:MAG: Dabb family protein [Bacteroidaceae bacterium]|nr:Dabb family protein [Bacteroidaceae bacterium]
MVKHIVLFKLKKEIAESHRLEAMNKFKEAIEALPSVMDFIRKVEVGFNCNDSEVYDIALYSEFDSLEDVKRYATHPQHVAAGKLLADVKESRSCVDYDF